MPPTPGLRSVGVVLAAVALVQAGGAVGVVVLAGGVPGGSGPGVVTSIVGVLVALLPAVVASRTLAPRRPGAVTSADLITMIRMAMAGVLGAAAVLAVAGDLDARGWPIAIAVGATLLTDAVDGPVARRTGTAGPVGARIDMEADAALLLVLSGLAALTVGPWVLAISLLRYAYVVVSRIRPALTRPLAYSEFRRGVAALQGITLLVVLVPVVPAPAARGVAGIALGLLLVSFGRDIVGQEREHRREARENRREARAA